MAVLAEVQRLMDLVANGEMNQLPMPERYHKHVVDLLKVFQVSSKLVSWEITKEKFNNKGISVENSWSIVPEVLTEFPKDAEAYLYLCISWHLESDEFRPAAVIMFEDGGILDGTALEKGIHQYCGVLLTRSKVVDLWEQGVDFFDGLMSSKEMKQLVQEGRIDEVLTVPDLK
jgi:hypothetical protein